MIIVVVGGTDDCSDDEVANCGGDSDGCDDDD